VRDTRLHEFLGVGPDKAEGTAQCEPGQGEDPRSKPECHFAYATSKVQVAALVQCEEEGPYLLTLSSSHDTCLSADILSLILQESLFVARTASSVHSLLRERSGGSPWPLVPLALSLFATKLI